MCEIISPADIRSEFESFGIDLKNETVIDKVQEFCQLYKLNAEGIVETWLAFSTSHQMDNEPNLENLARLETEELTKKKKKKALNTSMSTPTRKIYNANTINELIGDCDDLMDAYCTPDIQASKKRQHTPEMNIGSKKIGSLRNNYASPSPSLDSPMSISSWTPSGRYATRSNIGDVVVEFGNRESDRVWENSSEISHKVRPYEDCETVTLYKSYRYMYEKLRNIHFIMNDRIEATENMLRERLSLNDELMHIRMPSVKPGDVVGRIFCDSIGKLNQESLMLECSHGTSNGAAIPIDVGNLASYSFFPGQISAFSGTNPVGKKFIAHKIHDAVFPPLPSTSFTFVDAGVPFHLIACAGPYTTSDTLCYDPLEDFLKVVQDRKPQVCIMIGPFLDHKNKEVEEGNFDDSFEDIFVNCISRIVSVANSMPHTEFVVVSSMRDVHHYCVYPTPPYALPSNLPKCENLQLVADPSLLTVGGVVIGATSTDIIFHLGKEEISFPPGMSDRLGRLAGHLLSQQSFYPLSPPSEDVNINYEKFDEHAQIPVTPHILLLPSDLNGFVKDIKGCCCINPQRLTRGIGAGTYSRLQIATTPSPVPGSSLIPNIYCEVVRI